MRVLFIIIAVNMFLTTISFSQSRIKNLQSYFRESKEEGFSINLNARAKRVSGNVNFIVIEPSLIMNYVFPNGHRIFSKTKYGQAIKDNSAFIDNFFQHIRPQFEISKELFYFETFAQYEFIKSRRLDKRFLLGAGPRLVLFSSKEENIKKYLLKNEETKIYKRGVLVETNPIPVKKEEVNEIKQLTYFLKLSIGSAYMYEFNQYSVNNQYSDSGEKHHFHRWSNYLDFVYFYKSFKFINTIYYQPAFVDFNNYRLLNENKIGFSIGSYISIVISSEIAYNSKPAQGIQKLNLTLGGGINLSNIRF